MKIWPPVYKLSITSKKEIPAAEIVSFPIWDELHQDPSEVMTTENQLDKDYEDNVDIRSPTIDDVLFEQNLEPDLEEEFEPVDEVSEEPQTFEEAMNGPDAENWSMAMKEELESLEANETWNLEPVPRNKMAIGCKWVYKIKRDKNGMPQRYKARLVAQGFSQQYGIDYAEVFTPVVKHITFRALLSIAGEKNLILKHWDAKTAFLNGDLKEVIYLKQPPGFENKKKIRLGIFIE